MAYRTISITTDQPAQEGIASGTIYPGMALERTSTADTVQPHSVEDGAVNAKLVAVEDEYQGNGIATVYTADNRCFFKSFQPGDEAYMRIALGQNVAIGDELSSNGDGYLKKKVNDSSSGDMDKTVFGVALEASNCSAAAGFCRVQVA
jgi:hypothetical protein